MRLLLDTCTFLWLSTDPGRLSPRAVELIDGADEVLLSAASVWEIAIKHAIGKLPLPAAPGEFVPAARLRHSVGELAISERDAINIAKLPTFDDHKDPFDRMLIAQAAAEHCGIVTIDDRFRRYLVQVEW